MRTEQEIESEQSMESAKDTRRAHDIIWLVLFISVQIGMIVLIVFSSKYGSIDR